MKEFIEVTVNHNKTKIRKSKIIAFQEDSDKGGTNIWVETGGADDQWIVNEAYEDISNQL